MKTIFYGLIMCLTLGGCGKCRDMDCGVGECEKGGCACPEPYEGDGCATHKYADMKGVYTGKMSGKYDHEINGSDTWSGETNSFYYNPDTDSVIGYLNDEYPGLIRIGVENGGGWSPGIYFKAKARWNSEGSFAIDGYFKYYISQGPATVYTDNVTGSGTIDAGSKRMTLKINHESDYLFAKWNNDSINTTVSTFSFSGTLNN